MKTIISSIAYVDMLAPDFKMTYKYHSKQKTCLNGLLTVSIAAMGIVFGVLLGLELFLREVPAVSTSEMQVDSPQVRLYDNPMIFGVLDSNTLQYLHTDPVFMSKLTLTATHSSIKFNEEGHISRETHFLSLEPCKERFMSQENWAELSKLNFINVVLCLDPSKKTNFEGKMIEEDIIIRKPYGQMDAVGIAVIASICEDDSPECVQAKKQLDKGIMFGFTTLKKYIDTKNFSDPIKSIALSDGVNLAGDLRVGLSVEFNITNLFDDKGLIFEDMVSSSFSNFVRGSFLYRMRNNNREVFEMHIGTSSLVKHVERRYLKVTEFFANLGGFLKVTIMIGRLMAACSSHYSFYYACNRDRDISKIDLKQRVDNNYVNNSQPLSQNVTVAVCLHKKDKRLKATFLQYLRGLISSKAATKFGMSKDILFTYFDAKKIEESILDLGNKILVVEQTTESLIQKLPS